MVTKTQAERSKTERGTYGSLIRSLESWGAVVIPKKGMHEKLVFVDDDVVWIGSLNPLSYSNTEEIMERRHSRLVSADYQKTLRITELVSEYRDGAPLCPICRSEMVATEGKDEPYYWKCSGEAGCYTRSIDDEPIGEELRCKNCGAPVEFRSTEKRDAWRCTDNPKHWMPVARTHLRLPKMAAIVPKADLRRMAKAWGLDPDTLGTRAGRLF